MQQVRHLISRRKGVQLHHVRPTTDLLLEFGFEVLDMVDIILEVESRFHLVIPDELLLRTPSDFVCFLGEQLPPTPPRKEYFQKTNIYPFTIS
ncbi:MAG: acyl carrier protein [Hymenobacter sp.]